MKTVFVTTIGTLEDDINQYNSYIDYWTLVRLSGYEICSLGEIDYNDPKIAYVVAPFNGNVQASFGSPEAKNRKCKLILWQFEFCHKWGLDGVPEDNMDAPDVDEIWTSEPAYLELLKRYNPDKADRMRYIFLGGHEDYGEIPAEDKIYDLCDLSYRYGTRAHKIAILEGHGYSFAPLSRWVENEGYGEARDIILRHSKWGIQLHQFAMPFIAPQRFTMFASYRLPIISDYCAKPKPYQILMGPLIHFNPKESILANEENVREIVEYNYKLVAEDRTFRKEVDGML